MHKQLSPGGPRPTLLSSSATSGLWTTLRFGATQAPRSTHATLKLEIYLISEVPPAGLNGRHHRRIMMAQQDLQDRRTRTRVIRSRIASTAMSRQRFPICGHATFARCTWVAPFIIIDRQSIKRATTCTNTIVARATFADGSVELAVLSAELHVMPQ